MYRPPIQPVLPTLVVAMLLLFASDAGAGIFFVDNTNVSGPGSLQQAIAAANAAVAEPHEVRFSPDFPLGGTIAYTSESLGLSAIDITIDGMDRQPVLTRSSAMLTPMLAVSTTVSRLVLRNLTFDDIRAANAAACLSGFSSSPLGNHGLLQNVEFRNCRSINLAAIGSNRLGGAISWRAGPQGVLEVEDSVFVDNRAINAVTDNPSIRASGGAIYSTSEVRLSRSHFEANMVLGDQPSGGAIEVDGARLSVSTGVTFTGNAAGRPAESTGLARGGAISVRQGDFEMQGAEMVENSAWGSLDAQGGAVSISGTGTLADISESRFERNDALGAGGAIHMGCRSCETTLQRNTFDSNRADFGAAIRIDNSAEPVTLARVVNNAFLRNRTMDDRSLFGSLSLRNVSADVFHNSFLEDPDMPVPPNDISGLEVVSSVDTDMAIFNNLFGRDPGGTACYLLGAVSVSADGNLAPDNSCDVFQSGIGDSSNLPPPLLVSEGILTAPSFPGSVLVDGGALFTAFCPLGEDIFDRPRPNDGDGDGEAMCDVGAFEHIFQGIFRNGFEGG